MAFDTQQTLQNNSSTAPCAGRGIQNAAGRAEAGVDAAFQERNLAIY